MTRTQISELELPDPLLEADLRARLNDVEASLEKSVRSDTDLVTEATSHLVAAGGKRVRPLLVLLCGYFGDSTDSRLVRGATAIETVHLATLYHDDVIDAAEYRRGIPSVNARWDNTVAILAGDFLFARASDISSDLGPDVIRLLARTIAVLCDGQIREVTASGRVDQSEEAYMEIIRRKTARLMATSCRMGGMLSEAPEEIVERLDDFGMSLGVGFQLSDDIMDMISTEEELKKEPGQDLRLGVYTLPVLYALKDGLAGRELRALLEEGPPDGDRFERALELVRREEPISRARDAVTREVRRATGLAEGFPDGPARDALLHIARYIAVRCGAGS